MQSRLERVVSISARHLSDRHTFPFKADELPAVVPGDFGGRYRALYEQTSDRRDGPNASPPLVVLQDGFDEAPVTEFLDGAPLDVV